MSTKHTHFTVVVDKNDMYSLDEETSGQYRMCMCVMHRQDKWQFVFAFVPVVDIWPSFQLICNTVSHHCKIKQGRRIERWMLEVNALKRKMAEMWCDAFSLNERLRDGLSGLRSVLYKILYPAQCGYAKIEADEKGEREMENKIMERGKKAETDADGWKWEGERVREIPFFGGSCLLFNWKVLFFFSKRGKSYVLKTSMIHLKWDVLGSFPRSAWNVAYIVIMPFLPLDSYLRLTSVPQVKSSRQCY